MNATKPTPNSADWGEVIAFYQEIIHKHHWPFQPMLDLAQDLSRSTAARALYPSTSHEHLGFSLVRDYPQRVRLPQVWIHYRSGDNAFEVTLREYGGGPQETVTCGPEDAKAVAEQALVRLLDKTREQGAEPPQENKA